MQMGMSVIFKVTAGGLLAALLFIWKIRWKKTNLVHMDFDTR